MYNASPASKTYGSFVEGPRTIRAGEPWAFFVKVSLNTNQKLHPGSLINTAA